MSGLHSLHVKGHSFVVKMDTLQSRAEGIGAGFTGISDMLFSKFI